MLSFFSLQRPSPTARPIYTLYGSNDVVSSKDGRFGVRTTSDIIWGKCAPKSYQKGAFMCIFKPNFQNLKIAISPKTYTRSPDNETYTINDTSWVVHHYRIGNATWLTSAILKIDITSYVGRQRSDSYEIWNDDAKLHTDDDWQVKIETGSRISI